MNIRKIIPRKSKTLGLPSLGERSIFVVTYDERGPTAVFSMDDGFSGESYGEIHLCHGRRRFRFGKRHRRRIVRAFDQAARPARLGFEVRPVHEHRPRHDEPDAAWRSLRHL